MLVAIGYRRMRDRGRMHRRALELGYSLPSYVAASARAYPDLELGAGCIISDLVCLGPHVKLGAGVVVRPHSYVGHDGVVGDHAYLAPSVAVGGGCRIGAASFVGLGARIVDGVTVGAENLIGAGAVVIADTEPFGVYLGHPAVRVREHRETGVVLGS